MTKLSASLAKLVTDYRHLAQRSGLSLDRLADLVDGAEPKISEVRAISRALKLSIPALLDVAARTSAADIRFRGAQRLSTANAEARILSVVDLFKSNPSLVPRTENLKLSSSTDTLEGVDLAAQKLRELILTEGNTLIEPIPNLVRSLDQARIAHVVKLRNLAIHGAVVRIDQSPIIFVASQFLPRTLFSVAHELAHALFGHLDRDQIIVDADTVGSFGASSGEERLCDAFASALLLPAAGLVEFLKLLRKQINFPNDAISSTEILFTSHYFATSFLVAAFRFEQLGLLPRGGAIALDNEIKRNHESAEKFAAELNIPERQSIDIPVVSSSLRLRLRKSIADGDLSLGRLADSFGLSTGEMQHALT
jgi:Zn-dependent peptidase ImmA (M78 family)